jgi:hypothetical protein
MNRHQGCFFADRLRRDVAISCSSPLSSGRPEERPPNAPRQDLGEESRRLAPDLSGQDLARPARARTDRPVPPKRSGVLTWCRSTPETSLWPRLAPFGPTPKSLPASDAALTGFRFPSCDSTALRLPAPPRGRSDRSSSPPGFFHPGNALELQPGWPCSLQRSGRVSATVSPLAVSHRTQPALTATEA